MAIKNKLKSGLPLLTLLVFALGLAACSDKESPPASSELAPSEKDTGEQLKQAGTELSQAMQETKESMVTAVQESGAAVVEATHSAATTASANASADLSQGKAVYARYCIACHGTGAAGAPKLTDKADWKGRASQGVDTLTTHALKGFQGSKGYMPPRGGVSNLSDAEVSAAVAYILSEIE